MLRIVDDFLDEVTEGGLPFKFAGGATLACWSAREIAKYYLSFASPLSKKYPITALLASWQTKRSRNFLDLDFNFLTFLTSFASFWSPTFLYYNLRFFTASFIDFKYVLCLKLRNKFVNKCFWSILSNCDFERNILQHFRHCDFEF